VPSDPGLADDSVSTAIFTALALRHRSKLISESGLFTNLRLVAIVAGTGALQIALDEIPAPAPSST